MYYKSIKINLRKIDRKFYTKTTAMLRTKYVLLYHILLNIFLKIHT